MRRSFVSNRGSEPEFGSFIFRQSEMLSAKCDLAQRVRSVAPSGRRLGRQKGGGRAATSRAGRSDVEFGRAPSDEQRYPEGLERTLRRSNCPPCEYRCEIGRAHV